MIERGPRRGFVSQSQVLASRSARLPYDSSNYSLENFFRQVWQVSAASILVYLQLEFLGLEEVKFDWCFAAEDRDKDFYFASGLIDRVNCTQEICKRSVYDLYGFTYRE